jgi:RNA-binding motif protein, X-linked 2
MLEREEQSLNAKPEMIYGKPFMLPRLTIHLILHCSDNEAGSDSSESDYADIDPEDPMRDYLIAQRKEQKALKRSKRKGKSKHKDETPEERRARKEKKREKKTKKKQGKTDAVRGVEDLLNELESMGRSRPTHRRTPSPSYRRRSRSPGRSRHREDELRRRQTHSPPTRSRSRSPSRISKDSYRRRSPTQSAGNRRQRDYDRTPPARRRDEHDEDRTPPARRRDN